MKKASTRKLVVTTIIVLLILMAGYDYISARKKNIAVAPTKSDNKENTATSQNANDSGTNQTAQTTTPEKVAIDYSKLSMPVLMYHHIREYNFEKDAIGTNLSVAPSKFKNQLSLIQERGYATTTFSDLNNGNLVKKPIVLTFDDGYSNFYENAFPALKEQKMKAVVYIITDNIGKDGYMTAAQIKELSDYGIEIGAHTKSHPDLTTISTEKANEEITGSKAALEKIISKPVISFCYPSGKYNDNIKAKVKDAGYLFAVTTEPGKTNFNDMFQLTRDRMNSDTNVSPYIPEE